MGPRMFSTFSSFVSRTCVTDKGAVYFNSGLFGRSRFDEHFPVALLAHTACARLATTQLRLEVS